MSLSKGIFSFSFTNYQSRMFSSIKFSESQFDERDVFYTSLDKCYILVSNALLAYDLPKS